MGRLIWQNFCIWQYQRGATIEQMLVRIIEILLVNHTSVSDYWTGLSEALQWRMPMGFEEVECMVR
jgi:hypothetical protein